MAENQTEKSQSIKKKNMASDELVMFQNRSQNAQPQNEILRSKWA